MKLPEPPTNLRTEGKTLWRQISTDFEIEDAAGRRLLQSACECADLIALGQAEIAKAGLLIPDRHGVMRANPLLATVRDARLNMIRSIRALGLDHEEVPLGQPGRKGSGR